MGKQRNYGWYIVGTGFLILFLVGAARFAFGIVFKPMLATFGWSRGTLSLALTLNMAMMSVTQPLAGRLFDRHGPREVLLLFTSLTAVGLLCTGWIFAPWQLFFSYGILTGIGFGGVSTSTISTLISHWFPHKTGLTVGIAMGGLSLGQLLLIPFLSWLMLIIGWEYVYMLLGALIALICLPLILGVITLPDTPPVTKKKEKLSQASKQQPLPPRASLLRSQALQEVLRTRDFWWMAIAYVICGFGDFLVMTHLAPLATDMGLDPIQAGEYLGWMGGLSLPGVIAFGLLVDSMGSTKPLALTFLLRIIGFLLLLFLPNATTLFLFALIFGFTFFASGPMVPALLHHLYGATHLGELTGMIMLLHSLAGGIGGYIGGLIFDQTGSYQPAFTFALLLTIIATIASLAIREKRRL